MSVIQRLFASRKRPYIPGLNKLERVEVDISACKLRLLLPPHCSDENLTKEVKPIPFVNFYDPNQYPKQLSDHPFAGLVFIQRTWNFYGPIWKRLYIGCVNFYAAVTQVRCLPEGMSCLNPNHLEQVIIRMLYLSGPANPELTEKQAPVNWRTTSKKNSLWVGWETRKNLGELTKAEKFMESQYSSSAITALDDHHILHISFDNHGYAPPEEAIKHMNRLRDQVLNHIELEFSPTLKADLAKAKNRWPEAQISQYREPEAWVYPEWRQGDFEKGEPDVVIIKPGSTPPPFTP